MTDITELAQSMKAAATNVKETAHIARYFKATIARQTFKELMTPENILALVEALEKAQQRITQLEYRAVKLPKRHSMLLREDFNEDYHTEMAFKAEEVQASLDSAGIKVEAE
ncbi:TPA: hypothetical protein ACT92P_001647 [Klebsiella pneumoniae]